MPFGVFFGVNVGKTGDFYKIIIDCNGHMKKLIRNADMLGFSRYYR